MDKLIITLLVVIGVLVLFLGIALEEIKALQQDKRDWKNRYYAKPKTEFDKMNSRK